MKLALKSKPCRTTMIQNSETIGYIMLLEIKPEIIQSTQKTLILLTYYVAFPFPRTHQLKQSAFAKWEELLIGRISSASGNE